MRNNLFPKTTSLLLIATLTLAFNRNGISGCRKDPMDYHLFSVMDKMTLELVTFFLFFVGYIAMGAAFVFFMSERNNVAAKWNTSMTVAALSVSQHSITTTYVASEHWAAIEYRYMVIITTCATLMALKFPSLVGQDAITDAKALHGFHRYLFHWCTHHDWLRIPR